MMSTKGLHRDIPRTLLAVIEGSVDTNMFRHFYMSDLDTVRDVMRDGDISCAFFVSGVLRMFDLVSGIHGTVESTVRDLDQNNWQRVKDMRVGDILVWEPETFESGESHKHIGFYVGDGYAISNSSINKVPKKHHYKKVSFTNPSKDRELENVLRHPVFDPVSDL